MDLTFHASRETFNYRVAAVILHADRLMIMQDEGTSSYYLPGGRVHMGEPAEAAIRRELREELDIEARILRPLWLNQGFFSPDGTDQQFHELCLYFLMDISGTDLLSRGSTFFRTEGARSSKFTWVSPEALRSLCFYPLFLKEAIFSLPEALTLRTEVEPEFRFLTPQDLTPALFLDFHRHQAVTDVWRFADGRWVIQPCPRSIEDWGQQQREFICHCLGETLSDGGAVYGAFVGGKLKGIVAVNATALGSRGQYREIPFLQVSEEFRGQGVGRALFAAAKQIARELGGEMLYISSQAAVETQAFYTKMGCRDASEPSQAHIRREPFDRQLECDVSI